MLKPKHKAIILAILGSLIFWVVDAVIEAYLGRSGSFPQALFSPALSDLGERLVVTAVFLAAALLIARCISQAQKTAAALEDSENRYRTVTENSLAGIYLVQDNHFVYVNPRMAEIFGYTQEEMTTTLNPEDLVHPEDRALVLDNIRRRVAGEVDEARYTLRGLRQDGTEIFCEVHGRSLEYQGRPAIMGALLDITERHQAEEALRISEANYRTIFDGVNDVIAVIHPQTGKILDLNEKFAELFGYTREEGLGMNLADFCQAQSPYTIAEAIAWINRAAQEGPQRVEWLTRGQAGRSFWVEVTIKMATLCRKARALLVVRDISERKQMEQALKESEARFRMFAEESLAGIYMHQDGIITYINPRGANMFGYQPEELVDKINAIDVVHPDDRPLAAEKIRQLFAGEIKITYYFFRGIRKDGTVIHCENLGRSVDYRGRPTAIGTILDITDKQRAAEALREARDSLAALITSAPLAITHVDAQGTVLSWNPAAERIFGWSRDEVVGRPLPIIPAHKEEEFRELLQREMQGERFSGLELRRQRKDGALIDISLSSAPLYDAEGRVTGVMAAIEDITERKLAEQTRRESDEKYRKLMETAQVAIFIADAATGIILEANRMAGELLGLPVEEIIGMHQSQVHPAEEPAKYMRIFEEHVRQERATSTDLFLRRRDNRLVPIEISASTTEVGGRKLIMGVFRDLTERRQAEAALRQREEQLRQAQKLEAIGRLAGGVAHDFNNLLMVIMGYIDLIIKSLGEDQTTRRRAEQISKAAAQGASLTRQLLAFSRGQTLNPVVLDLNVVVDNAAKLLQSLVGDDIILTVSLDPRLKSIIADQGQMEQVLMNLAVNAREAMPDGGRLDIRTEPLTLTEADSREIPGARPGDFVCLAITDTGVGIGPDIINHIFEPFFSTKPDLSSGLGLSTVYGIVSQHEGWINVDSEPGRGATFRVYLPVAPNKSARKTAAPLALSQRRGQGERILLVEDDDHVRRFAATALKDFGYVVFEAGNATDALEVFEREGGNFQLIFCDVVLPGRSGLQLVEALKSRHPDLPVLLTSGYTDHRCQWPVICTKGFPFIRKPFHLEEMLTAIDRALLPS